MIQQYSPQQWIDDDGSNTVGTVYTAARMNTIEQGIQDVARRVITVKLLATVNVTLGAPVGFLAADNQVPASGDRVLLAAQTTASANGVYIFNGSANALTRAPEMASGVALSGGQQIFVASGNNYNSKMLVVLKDAAVGRDAITFREFTRPERVFSLPASGTVLDGAEIYYQSTAMQNQGVIWHLRYRGYNNDGTANAYASKWEYVGGGAMYAFEPLSAAIGSTAYGQVMDSGFVTPLPGDYNIKWGLRGDADAANRDCFAAIGFGSAPADDSLAMEYGGSVAPAWVQPSTARKFTGLIANQPVRMYLRAAAGIAGSRDKFIEMLPIRVG